MLITFLFIVWDVSVWGWVHAKFAGGCGTSHVRLTVCHSFLQIQKVEGQHRMKVDFLLLLLAVLAVVLVVGSCLM